MRCFACTLLSLGLLLITGQGIHAADPVDFKNSQTAKNLLKVFAGESQARSRYTFAASIAKKEGNEYIARFFEETAGNEQEHAKLFFAHLAPLAPEAIEIQAAYPVVAGNLEAQLKAAMQGENEESDKLYPVFAAKAREEGYNNIATTFENIAKIEKEHERRYKKLLHLISTGTFFKREESIRWQCLQCGHMHEGKEAPGGCPTCKRPRAFFAPLEQL